MLIVISKQALGTLLLGIALKVGGGDGVANAQTVPPVRLAIVHLSQWLGMNLSHASGTQIVEVQDGFDQSANVSLSGAVASVNTSNSSFVLTTPSNGQVMVLVSPSTSVKWNATASAFSALAAGEKIMLAKGALNPVLNTLQAQSVAISQPVQNIAYGPNPSQALDLCIPNGRTGNNMPTLLIIHGGGFQQGDKGQDYNVCRLAEANGFIGANINYRLVGNAISTPLNPEKTNIWPAQIEDAQLAVRFLRANAQSYGINPNFICAYGESAGGTLALLLGELRTNYPGDMASLYQNQSPSVACVIDNSGPTNMTSTVPSIATPARKLVGGASTAALRSASPVFYVSAAMAPVFITQGTQDILVPPSQAQELYEALQKFGVRRQYVSYVGGHVFGGLTLAQRQTIQTQSMSWSLTLPH